MVETVGGSGGRYMPTEHQAVLVFALAKLKNGFLVIPVRVLRV